MVYRSIEEYLKLPYTIQVTHDVGDDYDVWFARVVELPGCMTEADTFDELGPMAEDAMRAWITTAIEDGQPVPEPRPTEDYSGKLMVRLPRSLHRELAETADREGISLNSCVTLTLERGLRAPAPVAEPIRTAPTPPWSRLSDAAWRSMTGAGLRVEAQAVDEELFATWLSHALDQTRSALQAGYTRDALSEVNAVIAVVESLCGASPLLTIFCGVLETLREQIEESARYRQGLVQQMIQADISRQIEDRLQNALRASAPPTDLFSFVDRSLRGK